VEANSNAGLAVLLLVSAVVSTALLVGICRWSVSQAGSTSRLATLLCFFSKMLLWAFLLDLRCESFTRKPRFQENAFERVGFAMVPSPTRAYVGVGNSLVEGYGKFSTGSGLVVGTESKKRGILLIR